MPVLFVLVILPSVPVFVPLLVIIVLLGLAVVVLLFLLVLFFVLVVLVDLVVLRFTFLHLLSLLKARVTQEQDDNRTRATHQDTQAPANRHVWRCFVTDMDEVAKITKCLNLQCNNA